MFKIIDAKYLNHKNSKWPIVKIIFLLAAIFLLFITVYIIVLNYQKLFTLFTSHNKIMLFILLIIFNTVLSLAHELGHILFANLNSIYIEGIYMKYKTIFPLFVTKYNAKNINSNSNIWFYAGGTINDLIIGGLSAILYITFNAQLFLLPAVLNLLRVFINILPIKKSDGQMLVATLIEQKKQSH